MPGCNSPALVVRQGVRVTIFPSARRGVSRPDVTLKATAVIRETRTPPAPSAGVGSDSDSAQWDSVRIVCDDGVVPASLGLLARQSASLRSKIKAAVQQLEPTPADWEGGCFSLARPVDIEFPGTTVDEWRALLQQLNQGSSDQEPDFDVISKVLCLAHKEGMTCLLTTLDRTLRVELRYLTMDPADPQYMIRWLVLADRYQLNRTVALCLSKLEPQPVFGFSKAGMRWLGGSFYAGMEAGAEHARLRGVQSSPLLEELTQLSPGTLVKMLEASSRACMMWGRRGPKRAEYEDERDH